MFRHVFRHVYRNVVSLLLSEFVVLQASLVHPCLAERTLRPSPFLFFHSMPTAKCRGAKTGPEGAVSTTSRLWPTPLWHGPLGVRRRHAPVFFLKKRGALGLALEPDAEALLAEELRACGTLAVVRSADLF